MESTLAHQPIDVAMPNMPASTLYDVCANKAIETTTPVMNVPTDNSDEPSSVVVTVECPYIDGHVKRLKDLPSRGMPTSCDLKLPSPGGLLDQRTIQRKSMAFAHLVPTSAPARASLRLRANQLRRSAVRDDYAGKSAAPRAPRHVIARLDFAFFSGRQYLSFGSARTVEFRLSAGQGISGCHFLVRFDTITSRLLLTDVSAHGTWLHDHSTDSRTLLHQATQVVTHSSTIALGEGSDLLSFELVLADFMHDDLQRQTIVRFHQQAMRLAQLTDVRQSSTNPEVEAGSCNANKRRGSEDIHLASKRKRNSSIFRSCCS